MYANFPSEEASTSCGSGPDGTRPTIFNVAGSTMSSEVADFSRMSNAGEGASAGAPTAARNDAHTKTSRISNALFVFMRRTSFRADLYSDNPRSSTRDALRYEALLYVASLRIHARVSIKRPP